MNNKEKFDYLVKKYNLIITQHRLLNSYGASIPHGTLTVLGHVADFQSNTIRLAKDVLLDPANEILFLNWKTFSDEPISVIEDNLDMIIKKYNQCLKKIKKCLVSKKLENIQQDFE